MNTGNLPASHKGCRQGCRPEIVHLLLTYRETPKLWVDIPAVFKRQRRSPREDGLVAVRFELGFFQWITYE